MKVVVERALARVSALRILFEKLHRIADGEDGLGGVVRNFAAELFFESHYKLDRVEAVRAQILDEARLLRYLVGLDAQVLHDDLLHPLGNVTHRSNLCFLDWAAIDQPQPGGSASSWW